MTAEEYWVSFWVMKMVASRQRWRLHNTANVLNATELYTQLNLCCGNFTLIKKNSRQLPVYNQAQPLEGRRERKLPEGRDSTVQRRERQ